MGYSFRLAAMVLLYASSHRQDNTYNHLCYISRGEIAQWVHLEGSIRRTIAPRANALLTNTNQALYIL